MSDLIRVKVPFSRAIVGTITILCTKEQFEDAEVLGELASDALNYGDYEEINYTGETVETYPDSAVEED